AHIRARCSRITPTLAQDNPDKLTLPVSLTPLTTLTKWELLVYRVPAAVTSDVSMYRSHNCYCGNSQDSNGVSPGVCEAGRAPNQVSIARCTSGEGFFPRLPCSRRLR